MQQCVLVVGIGRSGTSPLSGVLSALGVDLGTNLIPADESNPRGYFESASIVRVNNILLWEYGGSYIDPPVLPRGWVQSPDTMKYRRKIQSIIETEYHGDLIGIKDPRFCMVLPLYQDVLQDMGIAAKVILVSRPKEDLVKAWSRVSKVPLPVEMVRQVQARYYGYLDDNVPDDALGIEFPKLLSDTAGTIEQLIDYLGLTPSESQRQQALAFVDKRVSKGTSS